MLALVYEWFWRTRMSFYNLDDDLQLPWFFGLACWNYAIAGCVMFWVQPQWTTCRFPYQLFALAMIAIQSPLSYLADYQYLSGDSYWHVADRLLACPAMALELWKYAILLQNQTYLLGTRLAYGMALIGAVYCFLKSQQAQENLDRDMFILWHTCWHLYPLIASGIILFDYNYYHLGGKRYSIRMTTPPARRHKQYLQRLKERESAAAKRFKLDASLF
jgi:hypothetical protein